MKNLGSKEVRNNLARRINALQNTPANWRHSMTGHQVVVHLADVIRVVTDNKKVKPAGILRLLFSLPGVCWLVTVLIPWVPGIPAQPEFMEGTGGTPLTTFENDKKLLIELMEKLGNMENNPTSTPDHPVFAALSIERWKRLMYRHITHHLWQFGPIFSL